MKLVNSANEAWLEIMKDLYSKGAKCSPRGLKVQEIKNYSICIKNPKKRIISNPIRKMSLPYAFGELLWYLSGKNDVATMQYYSKRMKNFSDDGETLNSAYGYRIFGHHPQIPFNQWEHVVNLLKQDKDSRQAIIHLHTPNNKPTKDEVCTLTLQFLIRNGKLDMVVNMRSNDVVWGFTYDVFNFTSFQELMANELEIPVGYYYHNAASMHIYEKDFKMLKTVNDLYPTMKHFCKYDTEFDYGQITIYSHELMNLLECEENLRNNNSIKLYLYASPAFRIIRDVLIKYNSFKFECASGIQGDVFAYDNVYDIMLQNQFARKSLDNSELIIVEGMDGIGKTTLCKNEYANHRYVHFAKPTKEFNPSIYYMYALISGNVVLDRYYFSEFVYSQVEDRKSIVTDKEYIMLNKLLNYRKAKVTFMLANPGDEDKFPQKAEDSEKAHRKINSLYNIIANHLANKFSIVNKVVRYERDLND